MSCSFISQYRVPSKQYRGQKTHEKDDIAADVKLLNERILDEVPQFILKMNLFNWVFPMHTDKKRGGLWNLRTGAKKVTEALIMNRSFGSQTNLVLQPRAFWKIYNNILSW